MNRKELWRAAFRLLWGTNAEMEHPRVQAEAEKAMHLLDKPVPKTETAAKIQEASEAIDTARESTNRLARLQPARNLDEALRQLVGERR